MYSSGPGSRSWTGTSHRNSHGKIGTDPIFLISLVSAQVLLGATYSAACPEDERGTLQEWMCFGELDFAARTDDQPQFGARFVFFDNRERLYEKREAGAVRMMMRGEGWQLYRGLGPEDSTVIGSFNPFLFFEFALMVPYIALAASEGAPSALPAGTTPVHYAGQGKAAEMMREMGVRTVDGAIERSGAEYAFRAQVKGSTAHDVFQTAVQGRWSSARVAPLPDSMPLAGWQYGCPRAPGTDVRGNHRPVPEGTTVGDLRRGWRGPCAQ